MRSLSAEGQAVSQLLPEKGILYLCATPIGNLEDISGRVLRVLREADLVAAEDTRHTRKLLSHFDIHTPLTSYHEHNKKTKGEYLLGQLLAGKSIALVTDAGLPGISDPGEDVANLAISSGVQVVPLPGPNAALTALVASGLPAGRFCFEGFLPPRGKARKERLTQLASEKRTTIIYESPHRLKATLSDLLGYLGNRRVTVARELTKKFEEFWRGTLEEAVNWFGHNEPRGEFVLVLAGAEEARADPSCQDSYDKPAAEQVLELESRGMARKEAIREVARLRGMRRREVYAEVARLRGEI